MEEGSTAVIKTVGLLCRVGLLLLLLLLNSKKEEEGEMKNKGRDLWWRCFGKTQIRFPRTAVCSDTTTSLPPTHYKRKSKSTFSLSS
jgi:hypothetical protein